MRKYKIAFCGMGSIGKRHLKNVVDYISKQNDEFTVDLIRSGDTPLDKEISDIINRTFTYSDSIDFDYDIIFITNPTSRHFDTILNYQKNTKHYFIEKPVFDRTDIDLTKLRIPDDSVYYVACPLRYTNVIQYVRNNFDCNKVISVRAISSSYLPDWRPGSDYRNTYSAHKSSGGGVSIDLIHEWDYLKFLFGTPTEIKSFIGKRSSLEIDSDDIAVYLGIYDNKTVELHLDYFGRKTIREMTLFFSEETVVADIVNSQIRYLTKNKTVDLKEERNDYQKKEIAHFFDIINQKCKNDSTVFEAYSTLKICKGEQLL